MNIMKLEPPAEPAAHACANTPAQQPIPPAGSPQAHADAGCSGGEVFALRVLGDSMAPEFVEGDIVIVEPDGVLRDGSFVLAASEGEWIFRRLERRGEAWSLCALNPAYPQRRIADLGAVHGVIIQKSVPGRRRLSKHYR